MHAEPYAYGYIGRKTKAAGGYICQHDFVRLAASRKRALSICCGQQHITNLLALANLYLNFRLFLGHKAENTIF